MRRGYTLIECVTYIAVLATVLMLAYPVFHRGAKGCADLRRNAEQIVQATRAGERWREDMRHATGPVRLEGEALRIPQGGVEIVYSFDSATVRRGGAEVLRGVKSSRMRSDQRQRVVAWRWEVELASVESPPRMRPLFSFTTVERRRQ
jgi:Tfp pilus assembly protein PilE